MGGDVEGKSLRILVVEDEVLVAMLIEDALTLYEHKVVGVAENVAGAMMIAMREPIDLALCDIRLADGDSGVEAAAQLAAFGIPSLYLSGNCPARTDNPLVVGYMAKPFPTAALGRAVIAAHAVAQGAQPRAMPTGMQLYDHGCHADPAAGQV